MTRLSIIIPVYNTERYLLECLNSIFVPKYDDFEVILIDDGSTDDSGKICDDFARQHSNVIVFHEKNHGVSFARNLGMKNAKGNYIMFVDSDDTLKTNWTEVLENINDKDIYFIDERIDENENDILKYVVGRNDRNIIISAPTSKIYHKEFLEKNNIKFEEEIIHGEDMLFLLTILCNTKRIGIISKGIYNYRVYIGSSSRSFNEKIFKSDNIFHEKVSKLDIGDDNKEYLLQNSIFVLSQKISLLKSFKEAQPYFEMLNDNIHRNSLNDKLLIKKKYRPFIMMFKHKKYRMLYNTLKLTQKAKKESK